MYLTPSKLSLQTLLEAAAKRQVPTAEPIEVEVFWVAPDEDVEVWDRIAEPLPNPQLWVFSEYAGEPPVHRRDGRRYRKAFSDGPGLPHTTVTFSSSIYHLRPVTVVLQGRRIGQTHGPESALFTLFVCDTENRLGFPAYLREVLDFREEEAALPPPHKRETAEIG